MFDSILERFTGWLLLLLGCLLMAAPLLGPAWLENRHLAWQKQCLIIQNAQLREQVQQYRDMVQGLEAGDPVLLARLAYHYLNLKPADRDILQDDPRFNDANPITPGMRQNIPVSVLLHQPVATVGVTYPKINIVDTRLMQLTTGPARLGTAALGLGLIVLGLYCPRGRRFPSPAPAAI